VQRDLGLLRYLAITIQLQGGKYPHKNWSTGTFNNNSNIIIIIIIIIITIM
jgi:hypothetical protein